MRMRSLFIAACVAGLAQVGFGDTIGSPLIQRPVLDGNSGQVYVYNGITQPFQSAGSISSWSFFDQQSGHAVTPLLFQINGNNTFTLKGIGTTVISIGTGLRTNPFGLIAGTDVVAANQYTFGYTDRAYSMVGNQLTAGTSYTGTIPFDGPGVYTDQWECTAFAVTGGLPVTVHIGDQFGNAGTPFWTESYGIGRIYSAQATVPEPSSVLLLVGGALMLTAKTRKRPRTS